MHTNEIVPARTNPAVKAKAAADLVAMGLTVSEALSNDDDWYCHRKSKALQDVGPQYRSLAEPWIFPP